MAKSQEKDLGYLGEAFQIRLIHAFMEDSDFFRDLSTIIDQNMFTDSIMRTYVGLMKDYYESYQTVPSYQAMDMYFPDKIRGDIEIEQLRTFNESLKTVTTEAIDYIREVSSRFFKQQNIVRAANEILKVVASNGGDSEKYEQCVRLINDAINVGSKEDFGENVYDNIEDTLSETYRTTIPTGVSKLDETLEGGLGKGELGVIIGSSSFGKTSLTTSIAFEAAVCKCEANNNNGFKVLQIVFEDRLKQIKRKHFGKITGVEARNLSKPEYLDLVRDQVNNYENKDMLKRNLRIVRMPSGEITADYIKRYIHKQINLGFKPDLLIVDYFECLKHVGDKSLSEYDKEGITMRKFESLAGDLDMAIWIPSQGSRDSIGMDVVTMDKISGSIKKAQIAHIIISIARSNDDIANNRATIAVLKNRAGCSGKIWNNVYFNNGTCTINTDDVDEFSNTISFENEKNRDITATTKDIVSKMKKMAGKN